jgi:hypothetical protein
MMDKIRRLPLFPFLFALFPILSLWASNVTYTAPWMAVRPILLTLLVTSAAFFLLKLLYKSNVKAGVLVCVFILIFFSFGHIYGLLADQLLFGFIPIRIRYLIVICILLIGIAVWLLSRRRSKLDGAILPLNLISGLSLIYPLIVIIGLQITTARSTARIIQQASNSSSPTKDLPILDTTKSGYKPDIYYIILDSYTNGDVLKDCFAYDNSGFIDQLQKLGFYVATESRTNFTITDLSLASSLNMNYPQEMGSKPTDAADNTILANWIQDSMVQKALKKAGYKTVAFDNGYSPTDLINSDYYFSPEKGINKYLGGINPFESMLLKTTGGIILYEARDQLPNSIKMMLDSAFMLHRTRILNILQSLESVPDISEPTFTFAHILAPHNPFVFGPQGEYVSRNTPFTLNDDQEIKSGFKYISGYVDQVTYLNTRMIEIVKTILAKSSNPPIIIIQGDHGPSKWVTSKNGRSYILNAYFIPEGYKELYPEISPVNSFRVIFNSVFGTSLPLLKDETFFTTHSTIDKLLPVGKEEQKCNPEFVK